MRTKWSDINDAAYELTLRECFLLILLLLSGGVVAYSFVFEQWSILDSLYFTTVILTTVGYGDITPSKRSGKLFASIFALGGIVILGLALGVVGSRLVEAEIDATEKMKKKSAKALEKAITLSHLHHANRLNTNKFESSDSLSSLDSVGSFDSVGHKVSFEEERTWYKSCSSFNRAFGFFPGFGPLFIGALIIAKLEDWGLVDTVYYCVVTSTVGGTDTTVLMCVNQI